MRALGGSGWQASTEAFETYAEASLALCRAYLQASRMPQAMGAQRPDACLCGGCACICLVAWPWDEMLQLRHRLLLLQMAEADAVGVQRDLSSARLHLRGLIKQAQERYEEEPAFKELQQLLAQVEERQRGV